MVLRENQARGGEQAVTRVVKGNDTKVHAERRYGERSVARGESAAESAVLSSGAGGFLGENRPREVVPGERSAARGENAGPGGHDGGSGDERSASGTKHGGGASERADS